MNARITPLSSLSSFTAALFLGEEEDGDDDDGEEDEDHDEMDEEGEDE